MGRRIVKTIAALALAAAVVGCSNPPPDSGTADRKPAALSIAASSSLRFVLGDLIETFKEEHPDIGVAVSFGSSGSFYAQLASGAPFDIFLSADVSYPRELAAKGLALDGGPFVYAHGRLALWVPRPSPLSIETLGLTAVADPAVTRVAIANPAMDPYGRAAEAALEAGGVLDAVRSKITLAETASNALQLAQTGAADAAIVALSLAGAPAVAESGRYWVLPADMHPRLDHGGVIMRTASRPDAARAFRAFMAAQTARGVLARYGFAIPDR
jgi:molybdate transport system substrate-binding protein